MSNVELGDVAQIMIAVSSLVLSAVVFYYTRKSMALESLRAVRDSWMQLDAMALADDRNLQVADSLFNPDADADLEQARKRWVVLISLNPVVSDFMAAKAGLTPSAADTMANCRAVLRLLLRDADAYAVTQAGAYTGPFGQLCREVRQEIEATAPAAAEEPPACPATT